MSRYEVLLFLHIAGAIVWIGIGMTGQALLVWAYRKEEFAFGAKLQEAFSGIEAPAGILGPLLGLVTGIWLVVDGPWGFTDTWIVVGIAGFGAALAPWAWLFRDRGSSASTPSSANAGQTILKRLRWPTGSTR
ncbi:MAG: DUF2269 family protein [Nitriliruptorales bacterium]|nr:DUF2269 family protein [Nitriliruptorales bacterium]